MLELLLSAGANINAQNIVGDAPLHKAALNGRALSTDYLLRSGANVNIRYAMPPSPPTQLYPLLSLEWPHQEEKVLVGRCHP